MMTDAVDATGTVRRYRALVALGWPLAAFPVDLATGATPTVTTQTAEAARVLYDALSMRLPPAGSSTDQARAHARRFNWLPPLGWDDDRIDDPTYVARRRDGERVDYHSSIDHAVIERVLAGEPRPRPLTQAECRELVTRLTARGVSTMDIEEQYGLKPERYLRRGVAS